MEKNIGDKQMRLMKIFEHSDPVTTAKYIGITDGEISDAFDSLSLGFGCV